MSHSYPETEESLVEEEIHGFKIRDPYRWLENTSDKKVQEWIETQNHFTESVLGDFSGREIIGNRLKELTTYDEIVLLPGIRTVAVRCVQTDIGLRLFYKFRKAKESQATLCYQEGIGGERVVIVNPLEVSSEGLAAIDWFFPSNNGKLVAYGISEDGSEWSTLKIINVESGEHLSEEIPRARMASVAWLPDNSGFYYAKYPLPGTVPPGEENYHRYIYFHELGRIQRMM